MLPRFFEEVPEIQIVSSYLVYEFVLIPLQALNLLIETLPISFFGYILSTSISQLHHE
jgi:hypothetical protein